MLYFEYRKDILKLINDILTDTMSLLSRRVSTKLTFLLWNFDKVFFVHPTSANGIWDEIIVLVLKVLTIFLKSISVS